MTDSDFVPYRAEDLPDPVVAYLTARERERPETTVSLFAPDATVIDDGHASVGREAILSWIEHSSSEYTYTSEPVRQRIVDESTATVVLHLDGDFPGGTVDLRFQFVLAGGAISQLTIEA